MNLRKDRSDRRGYGKLGTNLLRRRALIDHRQMLPPEVVDESRRRIDDQRCAADDQGIRMADRMNTPLDHIRIKRSEEHTSELQSLSC